MVAIVLTTVIGLIGGAVASRSAGIYFLMITLTFSVIATYTLGQVTTISRLLRDRRDQPLHAGLARQHPRRTRTGSTTSRSGSPIFVYVADPVPGADAVRAHAPGRPRRADPDGSLGYNVAAPPDARLRLRGVPRLARRASSTRWWAGQIAPGDVDLPQTINLLVIAVIGGLVRIEGAWVGAFVFIVMQNYITRPASRGSASAGRSSAAASTRSSGSSSSRSCSSPPTGCSASGSGCSSAATPLPDEPAPAARRRRRGAGEMRDCAPHSLESRGSTARESRTPSKHEREEGITR